MTGGRHTWCGPRLPCILTRCWLQTKGGFAAYYRNSLLYLACIDLAKDLTPEERLVRAHDLAIAAFLAETIYNFGELVRTADRFPAGLPDVLMVTDGSSCTRFSMHWTTRLWHG